jgi:phosphoribosylglycinamide formyltransferase 2
LRLHGVDIRLFGKPESFARRRMGVALACAGDIESARTTARQAAAMVRPVLA